MKLLISLLLCSLFIIGSGISKAEESEEKSNQTPQRETQQNTRPYGQPFITSKNIVCNDSKILYNFLKNEPNAQVPIFYGLLINQHGIAMMMTQIFVNMQDNKFSIVESSSEGISCIISAGSDFDILPHMHEGDVQKGSTQEVNKEKLLEKVRIEN